MCYKFDSIKECTIAKSNRIYDTIKNNKFYKGYKFFYTFLGDNITQEELLQQTETLKKKPKISNITGQEKSVDVYKYDTLEYIGQYISMSEACRCLNIKDTSHTSSVANGKRLHVKGYIFKFTSDTTPIEDFKRIKNNKRTEKTKENMRKSAKTKKIEVYDYETCNFIAEYNSIEEACRKIDGGLLADKVSAVAKRKRRQHKGYIFKYATDTTPIEDFKINIRIKKIKEKKVYIRTKKVEVYEYTTCKFIAEYDSITETCKKINGNLSISKVSEVARGERVQHKGYIFKFATDTTPIEEFKNKK